MIRQVIVKFKLLKKHYCSKRSTDLLKKYAKKKKIAKEIYVTKIALLVEATFKIETFKEQLLLD